MSSSRGRDRDETLSHCRRFSSWNGDVVVDCKRLEGKFVLFNQGLAQNSKFH